MVVQGVAAESGRGKTNGTGFGNNVVSPAAGRLIQYNFIPLSKGSHIVVWTGVVCKTCKNAYMMYSISIEYKL